MMDDEPAGLLRTIVGHLRRLAIPHMVVGSFASTYHGEPRTTRDLDLVIDPSLEQLDALLAALDPSAFYVDVDVARDALARRGMFNVIEIATAWKLDFVIRKARAFSVEELARREPAEILGVSVSVATAEDTILAKLEWAAQGASERQLEDIEGILRVRGDSLDIAYVDRWVDVLGLRELWERIAPTFVKS